MVFIWGLAISYTDRDRGTTVPGNPCAPFPSWLLSSESCRVLMPDPACRCAAWLQFSGGGERACGGGAEARARCARKEATLAPGAKLSERQVRLQARFEALRQSACRQREAGTMVIRVFIASSSGSVAIKKRQQDIVRFLEANKIEFEEVDITMSEDQRHWMYKHIPQDKQPAQGNPLPPQIFSDDQYCGDYESFFEAKESNTVFTFLGMKPNLASSKESEP
ncbi:SH3 domain-binding glutamic acid-rich-like protein 2 [Paroedura picta]|uniref:SH3 domain-binding glutamic acid-rich-like protein 2 n=1 Tax=Paroedura picta TaxID=143630 RepID=UPI004056022C